MSDSGMQYYDKKPNNLLDLESFVKTAVSQEIKTRIKTPHSLVN